MEKGNSEDTSLHGRTILKIALQDVGWEGMDCTIVAQDRTGVERL
jgi:hypothetical protein